MTMKTRRFKTLLKRQLLPAMRHGAMLLIVALLFPACINDNDEPTPSTRTVTMPIVLRIHSGQVMTKSKGDPGITETFALPEYAYLFVYLERGGAVYKTYYTPFALDPELWVSDTNDGRYITTDDPIYRYTGNLNFQIAPSDEWTSGRVYVAVSKQELHLTCNGTDLSTLSDPETLPMQTLESLQGVTFTVDTDVKDRLQDIYSTPYDYNVSGNYYVMLDRTDANRPRADLLLYHVAAKVDLMWNVDATVQSELRISELTLLDLFGDEAYLFRPMENAEPATTYQKTLFNTYTGDDVGSQWYGRRYIYAIPYYNASSHFPVSTAWQFNGDASGSYKVIFDNAKPSQNAGFTPWVRGDVTFKMKPGYN